MSGPGHPDANGRRLKPETELLLFQARHAFYAAEQLLAEGELPAAAREAYAAMAPAAAALLCEEGSRIAGPIGVHAAFWERYAKPGRVAPELHWWLVEAYIASGRGGTDVPPGRASAEVARLVERARVFLETIHHLLGQRPPWPQA